MPFFLRNRALARATVFVLALAPGVVFGAGARLRIKNGHGLTVSLGKTREAAIGIRPDKNVWTLELEAAFVGADADLRDVTPNVTSAHWSIPVEAERLVLDATRFLASHVYRLELRREGKLLGGAFVYLYRRLRPTPSTAWTSTPGPSPPTRTPPPTPMPKGSL